LFQRQTLELYKLKISSFYLQRCTRKRGGSALCFTIILVYCPRESANAFGQNKVGIFYTGLFSTMIIAFEYVHFYHARWGTF
jgi:hypothetical protein